MEILLVLAFFIFCSNVVSFFVGLNIAMVIVRKALDMLLTDEYINKIMERTFEKVIKET